MLVTTILTIHALYMLRNGEQIVGELLVLSGACSNLVDRFVYGAVLDFIDLYVGPWHWYTFNLADTWVVVGVGVGFLSCASTGAICMNGIAMPIPSSVGVSCLCIN